MRKIIISLSFICVAFWQCEKEGGSPKFASQSGQGGSLARFAIVGNYLYTVDDRKLKVFDISSAGDPALKNTVDIGFEIETIFPFKDKLFIGSTSVVHIFSISDPLKPEKLSEAVSPQILSRCDPVVAKDTVAFASLRANGPCSRVQSILAVYDIKDITKPVHKGQYPIREPYGLGYWNDVLYVCEKAGLYVFDINDPYKPVLLKTIDNASYIDVIPYMGSLICWVSNGIIVYDISDNKNPVLLAKIT